MAIGVTLQQFSASRVYYQKTCYLSSNKVVSIYNDGSTRLTVGTISGTSISWGDVNTFNAPYHLTSNPSIIATDASTIVFTYTSNYDNNYFYIVAGTVSGNSISFGIPQKVDADIPIPNQGYNSTMIRKLDTNKFVVFYYNYNGGMCHTKVGTVSGTTISLGSKVNVGTVRNSSSSYFYDITVFNSSKFVASIGNNAVATNGTTLYLGTISSGTTHSYGSPTLLTTSSVTGGSSKISGKRVSDTKVVYVYYNDKSQAVTYSGTTLSVGAQQSITRINSSPYTSNSFCFDSLSESSLVFLGYGYSGFEKITTTLATLSEDVIAASENFHLQNQYSSWNIKDMITLSDTSFVGVFDNGSTNTELTYTALGVPSVVAPTVTTQAATNIAQTSCTGNGNITATGGANATRRGFCYKAGTSGDPTTSDSVAYDDGSFGTGAYTKGLTGLTAGTGYRVRAYAINSAGTSYGSTVQVTTVSKPTLTADYGSFTLTGQAALLHSIKKMTAVYGSFVLTGQSISLKKVLHVICSAGSFTLTGQSAILRSIKKMICAVGSFTLTGQDALFHKTLHLIGGLGSFALTGFDVILFRGRILVCEVGTFVLTGYDALFHRITKMTAEVGAFVLTGYDAVLYKVYKLICGMGSYILTGQDVAFKKILRMTLEVGSFTLTGEDIILYAKRILTADVGSFVLTGQDVSFKKILRMACLVGDYVLTGFAINMYRFLRMACTVGVFIFTGFGAALQKTLHIIGLAGSYVLTGFKATFTGHGDWLWKITPKDDGSGWTITPKN